MILTDSSHNIREIKKIMISDEKDGAFAVVDIDTLWIGKDNNKNHWKGRVLQQSISPRLMTNGRTDYAYRCLNILNRLITRQILKNA